MTEQFVTYEQALALKELGFDEPCMALFFNGDKQLIQQIFNDTRPFDKEVLTLAPLKQQIFRFFREKYKLLHNITEYNKDGSLIIQIYQDKFEIYNLMTAFDINEYEEAESACIDKLIEIAKTK